MPASNATFIGQIGDTQVVYKPIAGERPLWDFPDGTLAGREVAAHAVSEALGWSVVPPTWLRDGPHGVGMVQQWREPVADADPVTLVAADEVEQLTPQGGWHRIVDGLDPDDRVVSLVHEESAALRRMAVFDVITNNADRKGGHVLPMADGHRFGVDHGLTFHTEHKLRTVLWGWIDAPLTDDELFGVRLVRDALDASLGHDLSAWISTDEINACRSRCDALLDRGTFPPPSGDMPAVPWPPF